MSEFLQYLMLPGRLPMGSGMALPLLTCLSRGPRSGYSSFIDKEAHFQYGDQ